MEIQPNGDDRLVVYGPGPLAQNPSRRGSAAYHAFEETSSPSTGMGLLDVWAMLRRYWLLLVALLMLGAAAGVVSVVLSSPMYKARLLLEVSNDSPVALKDTIVGTSFESNEVNIQTQVSILRSGPFLKRGADRLQSENVPLSPSGRDLFSRLRQRARPAEQDPLENAKYALNLALSTFDARPVVRTRLIELSCESTSPDLAAQFLNAMAAEFAEDTTRSRMQSSQKTSEWLSVQIEETKSKLQDSEEHLRDFVQASGNLFAGETSTLDDTKLAQLKGELAKIQAERIERQTRYELTLKSPPGSLPEVLNDSTILNYQQQISTLKREKAALETTYTAKHEKVQRVDAQLALLEKGYQSEIANVLKRIKNEYEASLRHEKLLASAYAGQSQRVGAEAGKAAQYNALKREVETLRQMYQSLLVQANQAGLTSSVPVNPIRIVEPSSPPAQPYKPQPVLNISFGSILGLVVTAGIAILKERTNRRISSPRITRELLNIPQLGVIPGIAQGGGTRSRPWGNKRMLSQRDIAAGDAANSPGTALVAWQNAPKFVSESFRSTLASILRNQGNSALQKTILITSPAAAEGKTTVVQNLGIALAETGRSVLLIDADFRRPHLHHRFGLPNDAGLIDLLSETSPVSGEAAAHWGLPTAFPGLKVLPNRSTGDNLAKALYSKRLRAIFEQLRTQYDMILVDAPPILHLADARIIAPLTDALILVLRCDITDRDSAVEAYQQIRQDGLTLLGTVLTDWNAGAARNYYYDYADNDRA